MTKPVQPYYPLAHEYAESLRNLLDKQAELFFAVESVLDMSAHGNIKTLEMALLVIETLNDPAHAVNVAMRGEKS